jgi:hypothetical protein
MLGSRGASLPEVLRKCNKFVSPFYNNELQSYMQVENDMRGSTVHREKSCDVASKLHSKLLPCYCIQHV